MGDVLFVGHPEGLVAVDAPDEGVLCPGQVELVKVLGEADGAGVELWPFAVVHRPVEEDIALGF